MLLLLSLSRCHFRPRAGAAACQPREPAGNMQVLLLLILELLRASAAVCPQSHQCKHLCDEASAYLLSNYAKFNIWACFFLRHILISQIFLFDIVKCNKARGERAAFIDSVASQHISLNSFHPVFACVSTKIPALFSRHFFFSLRGS